MCSAWATKEADLRLQIKPSNQSRFESLFHSTVATFPRVVLAVTLTSLWTMPAGVMIGRRPRGSAGVNTPWYLPENWVLLSEVEEQTTRPKW